MTVLSVSAVAGAEEDLDVPRLFGVFTPKLGAWSEYAVFDKATGKRTVMRMSIVGIENEAFWYEVMNREGEESKIVRMLVKGDPNDPENIRRFIIKSGNNPAMEMPREFAVMGRSMAGHMFEQRSGIPSGSSVHLQNVKTGEGSVTVPAGTFDVSLHDIVDDTGKVYAEYKFSRKVRPFGVVTSDTPNKTMVLAGHGDDAESLITEEPVMMTQPPGMPEGMPRGMPPGRGPETGRGMRQIPGMSEGYEPKE
jgi:hypothetical protein